MKFLLLYFLLPFFLLFSEKKPLPPKPSICATNELLQEQLVKNPDLKLKDFEIEKKYSDFIKSERPQARGADYILPVVIHIIHNDGTENISDNQAIQAITDLNLAFANQGFYDPQTGTDTNIQFCLAKQSPDGSATSGINRIKSPLTTYNYFSDDLTLKNLSRWNPLARLYYFL